MTRTVSIFVVGWLTFAAANSMAADVPLSAKPAQLSRVQVALQVEGQVLQDVAGKVKQTPIRVEGALAYHERLVRDGEQLAAVRYYDHALAKMDIGGTQLTPRLRDDRRLIVVRPHESRMTMFAPAGTLRREELDMLDVQGNTLVLADLLPGGTAKLGQTWRASDATLAALLALDKLTLNSSQCKLDKVEGKIAQIALSGQIGGSVDGSLTEIVLDGTLGFDIERKQVAWLVLKVDETRMSGPAGPGIKVTGKLRVTLSPLSESEYLSDAALAKVSLAPTAPLMLLRLDADNGQFRTWHDRRWYVIDQRDRTTILRMIEDGERIAQCNITTADPPADASATMTLAKFRAEVAKSLDKFDAEVILSEEYTGRSNHRVFGVVCQGKVSGVDIIWNYYHVINTKTHHRATLVVTLEASRAGLLARTDLMLARSMQLLDVKQDDAEQSVAKQADEAKQ